MVGAPVVRTPCVPRGAWRTNGCITIHAYEYCMKVPSYCVWQGSWHTHRAGHATSWTPPTRWADARRLTHCGAKSAMCWKLWRGRIPNSVFGRGADTNASRDPCTRSQHVFAPAAITPVAPSLLWVKVACALAFAFSMLDLRGRRVDPIVKPTVKPIVKPTKPKTAGVEPT